MLLNIAVKILPLLPLQWQAEPTLLKLNGFLVSGSARCFYAAAAAALQEPRWSKLRPKMRLLEKLWMLANTTNLPTTLKRNKQPRPLPTRRLSPLALPSASNNSKLSIHKISDDLFHYMGLWLEISPLLGPAPVRSARGKSKLPTFQKLLKQVFIIN